MITYYGGMLLNQRTGRYHPIFFLPSPKPSEADEVIVRHRSKFHHTDGFASETEARLALPDFTRVIWTDIRVKWDGVTSPRMIYYFPCLGT